MQFTAEDRYRYASLILKSGVLAAFLATVVSALAIAVLSAARPLIDTTSPSVWDIGRATLLLLPIIGVSCGSYGFLAGMAGGALLTLRRRHIHSIQRLLIESATTGFLLGVAFPFFDRLMNNESTNVGSMLLAAPSGTHRHLLCLGQCLDLP
jgi:hypothetical protein